MYVIKFDLILNYVIQLNTDQHGLYLEFRNGEILKGSFSMHQYPKKAADAAKIVLVVVVFFHFLHRFSVFSSNQGTKTDINYAGSILIS